jgi:putative redox protein
MPVAQPVRVTLSSGTAVQLTSGTHTWQGDEPVAQGGTDTGPNPYELLLGSLGTCTAITLRMYAQHKQMDLTSVDITTTFSRELAKDCPECEEDDDTPLDVIRSTITIRGTFDEAQRERLTQVASRCPVHKTLTGGPRMYETVAFEPS